PGLRRPWLPPMRFEEILFYPFVAFSCSLFVRARKRGAFILNIVQINADNKFAWRLKNKSVPLLLAEDHAIFISRSASPTAARLASFISEYLREMTSPVPPPRKQAFVHSLITGGLHRLNCRSTFAMSTSRPGQIWVFVPLTSSTVRFVSR